MHVHGCVSMPGSWYFVTGQKVWRWWWWRHCTMHGMLRGISFCDTAFLHTYARILSMCWACHCTYKPSFLPNHYSHFLLLMCWSVVMLGYMFPFPCPFLPFLYAPLFSFFFAFLPCTRLPFPTLPFLPTLPFPFFPTPPCLPIFACFLLVPLLVPLLVMSVPCDVILYSGRMVMVCQPWVISDGRVMVVIPVGEGVVGEGFMPCLPCIAFVCICRKACTFLYTAPLHLPLHTFLFLHGGVKNVFDAREKHISMHALLPGRGVPKKNK